MSHFRSDSGQDAFCNLIELLSLSKPKGLVAMINAYLDAGKDKNESVLTVAIVAYGGQNAIKAHRLWKSLWGDLICHMTDLHNRKNDFDKWTNEQVDAKFIPSIAIIKGRGTYRVAVSCSIGEFDGLTPKVACEVGKPYLDAYSSPYAFCCHMAMMSLAEIAELNGDRDGINYVLEAGDEHQGALRNFINFAESMPPLRKNFGIRSHAVLKKEDARLLESADILAWEWSRHVAREVSDNRVRKSLQILLNTNDKALLKALGTITPPGYALHYAGESFAEHLSGIGRLIASGTISEEARLI